MTPSCHYRSGMDEAKLNAAVERCLQDADRGDRIFRRVGAFIAGLRADTQWTAEEAVEVQIRVLSLLMLRQHGQAG